MDNPQVDPNRAADVFAQIIAAAGDFGTPATQGIDIWGGIPSAGFGKPNMSTTTVTTPNEQYSSPATGDQLTYPGTQEFGVNSPFGPRNGGNHPGVDLAFPDHATVLAATSGTVTEAVNSDDPATYNVVTIEGPNGIKTRYGHLSGVNVNVGDQVQAGQVIGASGGAPGERGTYNSSGPHLHFEVYVNGQLVDPAPLLAGGARIVGGPVTSGGSTTTTTKQYSPEQILGMQLENVLKAAAGETPPNSDLGPKTTMSQGSRLSGQTTGADNDPNAVDAFLAATRNHESGGNYQIQYQGPVASDASGAYGFLGSTWRSMGGSTQQAYQASPEEQDAVARKMAMQLFEKYGSWRLVAIAWYGGPGIADQVAAGRDPGSPSGQPSYLSYGDYIANAMSGGG